MTENGKPKGDLTDADGVIDGEDGPRFEMERLQKSGRRTQPNDSTDEKAPCRECTSKIPAEATRCPSCGYDPSPGILATFGLFAFGPLAGIGALLALFAVGGTLAGMLTLGEAAGALVATLVLFGPPGLYVRWYLRKRKRTAAEVSG